MNRMPTLVEETLVSENLRSANTVGWLESPQTAVAAKHASDFPGILLNLKRRLPDL
jgi:hypothetical protein